MLLLSTTVFAGCNYYYNIYGYYSGDGPVNHMRAMNYQCLDSGCYNIDEPPFFDQNSGTSNYISIPYPYPAPTYGYATYLFVPCYRYEEVTFKPQCCDSYTASVYFDKYHDCKSEINSMGITGILKEGENITINANIQSAISEEPRAPWDEPSDTDIVKDFLSSQTKIDLIIKKGSSTVHTDSTTKYIERDTSTDVSFDWLLPGPGEYRVEIHTTVPDCKCDSQIEDIEYRIINVEQKPCDEYSGETECMEDPDCEWCPSCDSVPGPFSGGPDRCVDVGTCNYYCEIDQCGATCAADSDCANNTCEETYDDYCDDHRLVEYDDDKVMDSTTVTDWCENTCLFYCVCTDCSVDCSAPSTNEYCVEDVCGAECDEVTDYYLDDSTCYYGCDYSASCLYQNDCSIEPYCDGNIRYYDGECSASGCSFSSEDCDDHDYYDDYEFYCNGSDLRKHRLFHDYSCSGGSCVESSYYVDDQLVEDCDTYDGSVFGECGIEDWTCDAGLLSCVVANTTPSDILCPNKCDNSIRYYDGFCDVGFLCNYSTEDCDGYDGSYCTQDMEGLEQRNYYCEPDACEYTHTTADCGLEQWSGGGNTYGFGTDPDCVYTDYYCIDNGSSSYCDSTAPYNENFDHLDDGAKCSANQLVQEDHWCDLSTCSYVDPSLGCSDGQTLYPLQFCAIDSEDSDYGDYPLIPGVCTDYDGCIEEPGMDNDHCGNTTYADYCDGNLLYEYIDTNSECGSGYNWPIDCESYEEPYCFDDDRYLDEWQCSGVPGYCNDTASDTLLWYGPCHDPDDNDGYADGCFGATYKSGDPDTDPDLCTCEGVWEDDFEAGLTGNCCDDDLGEYYRTCEMHISMDAGCQGDTTSCCDAATDCVAYGNCYSTGAVYDADNDGDPDSCMNGTWYDCTSDDQCPMDACDGFIMNDWYCSVDYECEYTPACSIACGSECESDENCTDVCGECDWGADCNDTKTERVKVCDDYACTGLYECSCYDTGANYEEHCDWQCLQGSCGAQCDSNDDCPANECNVTYDDYCVDHKLAEYDSDKVMDSTTVTDDCENTCLADCMCTDCSVDCSAPPINQYCVEGVCDAECDDDGDCPPSECEETYYDYCAGHMLVEYDNDHTLDSTTVTNSTPNTCLEDCLCTNNTVTCDAPETNAYCVIGVCGSDCDDDSDCSNYCDGNVRYYAGLCDTCLCAYSSEDCDDYDHYDDPELYCSGNNVRERILFHDYSCQPNNCVESTHYINDTFIENCDVQDGWYNTSGWTIINNGCKRCRDEEYRNYYCSAGSCDFNIGGTREYCDNLNEGMVCYTGLDECMDGCTVAQEQDVCSGGECVFDSWINQQSCSPYSCVGGACNGCSQACGAECDDDTDCEPHLVGDECYYNGLCSGLCACEFDYEYCPEPGTVEQGVCYFGTRECDDQGCALDQCILEQGQVCDPDEGCKWPDNCSVHTDPLICDIDPNCHWCPMCDSEPGPVNQWFTGMCIQISTPCGYECNVSYCSAECDDTHECEDTLAQEEHWGSECNGTKTERIITYNDFDCSGSCTCYDTGSDYDEHVSWQCLMDSCDADCDSDDDCPADSCEETYYDYCSGHRLVEYDDDKVMDSTTVTNSTDNFCLDSCLCTDNVATCDAPATNDYCVLGVCDAECEEGQTHDTQIDYCYSADIYRRIDGCSNNCAWYDNGHANDTLLDDCYCDYPDDACEGPKWVDYRPDYDAGCTGSTCLECNPPVLSEACALNCGAECEVTGQCPQYGAVGDVCYYDAYCEQTGCTCGFGSEDPNKPDGCYDVIPTQTVDVLCTDSGWSEQNPRCVQSSCGATCDSDDDCQPYLEGDECYYSGDCAYDCLCGYQHEYCPEPGTTDGDVCYYGTQACEENGCGLQQCTLGYNEVCDASDGCVPIECSSCQDCGGGSDCTDYGQWSDWFCDWTDICDEDADCSRERSKTTYQCVNPGTIDSYCTQDTVPETENKTETRYTEGLQCDDGLFCTLDDVCSAGVCLGIPRICDDDNECTDDICNENIDQCVFTPDDTNVCGLARDCPDPQCVEKNWTIWTEDGHDYCQAGTCIEYQCEVVSSEYSMDCDPACIYDTTPPSITNMKDDGDKYDNEMTPYLVQADVTDGCKVESVQFAYKFDSHPWSDLYNYSYKIGDTYYFEIPREVWIQYVGDGNYVRWKVVATDHKGLESQKTVVTGDILDDDKDEPEFDGWSFPLENPYNQDTVVSVVITDESGLASAVLHYDYGEDGVEDGTDSTPVVLGITYTFTIPAPGPDYEKRYVSFWVNATDADADRPGDSLWARSGDYHYKAIKSSENHPPVLSSGVKPAIGNESTVFTYYVTYTDVDDDPPVSGYPKVYINNVPHLMTAKYPADIDYTDGKEYIYTTTLSPGTYNFYFEASDGQYVVKHPSVGYLEGPTVIHGPLENLPPHIDAFSPVNTTPAVDEGSDLAFSVTASDPNDDMLTYSWLVDGVVDGNESTYTYSPGYDQAGTHNITAIVSDGELTDEQEWSVTVNDVGQPQPPSPPSGGGGSRGGGTSCSISIKIYVDDEFTTVSGETLTIPVTVERGGTCGGLKDYNVIAEVPATWTTTNATVSLETGDNKTVKLKIGVSEDDFGDYDITVKADSAEEQVTIHVGLPMAEGAGEVNVTEGNITGEVNITEATEEARVPGITGLFTAKQEKDIFTTLLALVVLALLIRALKRRSKKKPTKGKKRGRKKLKVRVAR